MINFKKRNIVVKVLSISLISIFIGSMYGLFNRKDMVLNTVSNNEGAINVYFNKFADTTYALENNKANYYINLEKVLIERISKAQYSIDIAAYEINLPLLVNTLIEKAKDGIDIRLIVDGKLPKDEYYEKRYELMKLNLEKLKRGYDGKINTKDDINLFSDSPIFAVEDEKTRTTFGLGDVRELNHEKCKVGNTFEEGYILCYGEEKKLGEYYSPQAQMHNKFVIIDDKWTWTGSWNFTVTGLYGTYDNMLNNKLDGNVQHCVEINSKELANIFKKEFNEMWGSNSVSPNPCRADFHSRKANNTLHEVMVNGTLVEVYFSPTDGAIKRMCKLIEEDANHKIYFSTFCISDNNLIEILKYKYENNEGKRKDFTLKGIIDQDMWNMDWSAGKKIMKTWANMPPIFKDSDKKKLHCKTMIIDCSTDSDPTVITGSTNWTQNAQTVNDENMIIIHDRKIANLFQQEFYARYKECVNRY